MNAQELSEMDKNNFDQVFQRILLKDFVFKIRPKTDMYNVSLSFRSGLAGSGSGFQSICTSFALILHVKIWSLILACNQTFRVNKASELAKYYPS